jgi:hypothetical protein
VPLVDNLCLKENTSELVVSASVSISVPATKGENIVYISNKWKFNLAT